MWLVVLSLSNQVACDEMAALLLARFRKLGTQAMVHTKSMVRCTPILVGQVEKE